MTDGETPPDSKNFSELNKARLDLAWKHFEHAISQRLTMFNFCIAFMGALSYAFVTTLKNDQTGIVIVQVGIGGFGIVAGIFFGLLDQRNQYLYKMAEYNIYLLEKTFLYKDKGQQPVLLIDPIPIVKDKSQSCYKGITTTQLEEGGNLRCIEKYARTGPLIKVETYGILMPLFYSITVVFFAIVAVSAYMGFLK